MSNRRAFLAATAALAFAFSASHALAQKKYDTGASDTEIKIGQTVPFSGAYSVYANIGKTQAAYFKMINDQGGINGRKINLISADDGYLLWRTGMETRKLIEVDHVAFTFGSLGTTTQLAVARYLNERKIPQLFIESGANVAHTNREVPGEAFERATHGAGTAPISSA